MSPQSFERTSDVPCSAAELFAWHTRPGAFLRLAPPWQPIELPTAEPEIRDGSRVEIRMRKGPFWLSWIAEHRSVVPGRSFEDVMVEGPFARWEHRHEFLDREGGSRLRDSITYEILGGAIGRRVAGGSVRADLERAFAYRHRVTAADLDLHSRFADRPRMTVAITGASGLVGSALRGLLTSGGHTVVPLERRPASPDDAAVWTPEEGLLHPERLPRLDAVVHLAGENIADGRWTTAKRRRIERSRVDGTRQLVRSLGRLREPPGVFVSASAVGYYGSRGAESLNESSSPGRGFLADVCRQWEDEAEAATSLPTRVARLRFGVVVAPNGGFLARLLPPFLAGLGGVVGDGRQYVNWVTLDDAISSVLHVLMTEEIAGAVNVVAPNPVHNRELTRTLGRVLRRPTLLPLPAAIARLAFGRMADETLLASTRAEPRRLVESGFVFRHRRLEDGLRHVLGR